MKTGGEIKVGWLVSRKERKKEEKERGCGGFQGSERRNSRRRGNEMTPPLWVPHLYIIFHNILSNKLYWDVLKKQ